MKILGLDISTRTTGWCIFDDGKVVKYGWIRLDKIPDMDEKADFVMEKISEILQEYKDDLPYIAVEEALLKLSGAKTTANTIAKLVMLNCLVRHRVYLEYGVKPITIPVNTARKLNEIKIPKTVSKSKNKDAKKEYVRQEVAKKHPEVKWPLNRVGNIDKKNFDVADSVVIAEAAWIQRSKKKQDQKS